MVIQRAGRSLFGIVDGLRARKLSRGYFEEKKPPSLSGQAARADDGKPTSVGFSRSNCSRPAVP